MLFVVHSKTAAMRKSREGMILLITLAILLLLSVLLVSFVSMATLDRSSTTSYGQSLRADQIAQGGLDQVVSQLQAEIADPALSTNSASSGGSNNLYIPIASTNAVPQRTAPYLSNLATLLSYSGTNLYTAGAGTTNYASASSTENNSQNGRTVSLSRWNKPQLTTSTSGFPVPQWILMTRSGPQSFATYNSSLGDSAVFNNNFVVGRYAYVLYDTSGLLDANVAGYPSTASASTATKGLAPWADLTQLTGGISQTPDVDGLVNWRNATTAANYATNVYTTATNNGFTRVANGDTTFLSRQELIKYVQTQNTDMVNALPYLTTFSRELNGPTWGPSTPSGSTINYATQQYVSGSFNPRIPNPRVQTGGWLRDNGVAAVAGEPLVKYRFPLDKLALLEKFTGTGSGTLTTADIANIQKYFGLDIASDSNGPSYRHWIYPTTSTTYVHGVLSGKTGIMTLDDVAQQNREPDFFELLQAGILSGSLGAPGKSAAGFPNAGRSDKYPVNGNGTAPPSYIDPDDSTTLQTLRIGANIIDQSDADSFPTTVTYTPPSGSGGQPISVEGVEDLPYPFAAYLNIYSASNSTTGPSSIQTALAPFNFYLYFELWNPHQTPSSTTAANYPANFRFYPFYNSSLPACSDSFVAGFANSAVPNAAGTSYSKGSYFYNGTATTANGANGTHTPYYMQTLAPSGIAFTYAPTTSGTDYREPALAVAPVGGAAPTPWNNIACLVLPPLTSFPNAGKAANNDGNAPFPAHASGASGPNSAWQCQYDLKMVMPVQYQDASGSWHTYSTFIGLEDPSGAYPAGTCYESYYGWSPVNLNASLSCPSLVKSDPRTSRFGVGSYGIGTNDVAVPLANTSGMVTPVTSLAPFGAAASVASPYRLDLWAANDSSTASGYSDVDGIRRWGDARNSYKTSPTTSPLFTNATANRPVILNRPFQSVGELGYVFRDMPWKTLDLASANSADSGLLDLFTVSDAPIVAGRVNPNTPYPQVLAALISGATQSSSGATTVSSANALTVAQAVQSATSVSPFVTRADLVNDFMTNSTITSTLATSGIKTEEESVVRALSESSNTRTWTFLIDIIAQSGRYPTSSSSLDNFVVEGERRYWLHISIDRYTGAVVDKQLEVVTE